MSTATLHPPLPSQTFHLQTPDPPPEALSQLISTANSTHRLLQLHAFLLRHHHLYPRHHLDPLCSRLLHSYSSLGPHHAFPFFSNVLHLGFVPNAFVFSVILKRSVLDDVRCVHGMAVKHGLGGDCYVGTGLIDDYAVDGDLGSARRVFDGIEEKSLVSSTAMMKCYARSGEVLAAREVFDRMTERDTVSWNVMIDGYAKQGLPNEALRMFTRMLKEGERKDNVRADEVTLVSVLNACSKVGALELGRWVHSYIKSGNNGIRMNAHLGTALVDMYSKCGSLEDATLVFKGLRDKDIVAWNSMILGYGLHGSAQCALGAFNRMCELGLNPNSATFVAILTACANTGLIEEGWGVFKLMKVYGVEPKIAHYGCMVNLLSRAGHLEEGFELIKKMIVEPDSIIWGSLLLGCSMHGQTELGEEIVKFLLEHNLANSGTYVLLSNMYASSGNWKGVAKVRKLMRSYGVEKEKGCSSIEVDNRVHEFLAGDKKHPKAREVYMMLQEINGWLENCGYRAQTDQVLHDLGEKEKEQCLAVHSERLAIAFGLISTQPGTTIRIVKNLRVCPDCHIATKLISQITGRRIIMRDRSRFHHFVNGSCSCGDYW